MEISPQDNSTSLFNKIAVAAGDLIVNNLVDYINGKLEGVAQDENEVTFTSLIKPEQEKLSFDMTTRQLFNMIRALSETPGGYFYLNHEKLKIFKASIYSNDVQGEVGEIINSDKRGLLVQCKDGQLALEEVQKEGKKKMDYKSFINGNQNLKGQKLE